MRLVKAVAIVWGLIYFALGAVFSFTLGSNEFWSGVAVYVTLFLLPLPTTLMALWRPKIAAATLIACVIVSVCIAVVSAIKSGVLPDFPGLCKFIMLHLPHVMFAAMYTKLAPAARDAYASSQR